MACGQRIHQPVPNASLPPANEAVVASSRRPVALRQIAPRRTRTQNPKDAVKHAPVIYARHTARLVRQHRFDSGPFIFGEFVAHDSRLLFWDLESQPVQSDQRRTGMPSVTPLLLRHRTIFGRSWGNSRQPSALGLSFYAANDRKLTFRAFRHSAR